MDSELLNKLVEIQNAHNEQGALYEKIAESDFYSDLKTLNSIYKNQNSQIEDLQKIIAFQRNEIRALSQNEKKQIPEEFRIEKILKKPSKQAFKPKKVLITNFQRKK